MTYAWEIARQARFARWAWDRLREMIATAEDPPSTAEKLQIGDRMHAEVQSILTAASQISKMLSADFEEDWEADRIAFTKKRAKAVQQVIRKPKVTLMKRTVRNALEHFDARLDDLLFQHPEIGLLDSGVGPARPVIQGSAQLRYLDYVELTFYVIEDSISLPDLMDEIARVGQRARDWLAKNGAAWFE